MKQARIILSVILLLSVLFVAPIKAGAQSNTAVLVALSLDIQGNVEEYLEALKPIIARVNEIQPKSKIAVYQAQFAGSDVGTILVVIDHPSMAYMEEMRTKGTSDEELAKLWPTLEKFDVTVKSRGLLLNRAPEQDRDVASPVVVLYGIDTHGKNDAFVEASKKIHERFYKVISNAAVGISEAMFTGETSGMIYIGVGAPSMAELETWDDKIAGDAELTGLFAERDKIGATLVSRSLFLNVTP
jgi:hypothetical protein